MKISISNIAWDASKDEEMYGILCDKKVEGLEIAPTRLWTETPYQKNDEAARFAEYLRREYRLSICSMQSIWYGMGQKLFGTKEDQKVLSDYTKEAILFAEAIGCGNLVFGCPKNRVIGMNPDGTYCEEDYRRAIEFFGELGEFAYRHNTCLSMEANPPIYQTNFINRTKEAIELVHKVNSPGFAVNGDFGTIIANGESLDDIKDNVSAFRHFHISEPGLECICQRLEHKELFTILKEKKYDYYVSIEMKKQEDIATVQQVLDYLLELRAV